MPNPLQAADLVGHSLRFSELGLTNRDLGNTLNVDLTAYKTAVPETVLVLVKLASGQVNVQVQATAAGTFSSADASTGALTVTYGIFTFVNTSVANPYVNVRLVTGSSGCRIDNILVVPLAKLTGSEDWFNIRDGVMAVASGAAAGTDSYHNPAAVSAKVDATSDGSGTFLFDYTV